VESQVKGTNEDIVQSDFVLLRFCRDAELPEGEQVVYRVPRVVRLMHDPDSNCAGLFLGFYQKVDTATGNRRDWNHFVNVKVVRLGETHKGIRCEENLKVHTHMRVLLNWIGFWIIDEIAFERERERFCDEKVRLLL